MVEQLAINLSSRKRGGVVPWGGMRGRLQDGVTAPRQRTTTRTSRAIAFSSCSVFSGLKTRLYLEIQSSFPASATRLLGQLDLALVHTPTPHDRYLSGSASRYAICDSETGSTSTNHGTCSSAVLVTDQNVLGFNLRYGSPLLELRL